MRRAVFFQTGALCHTFASWMKKLIAFTVLACAVGLSAPAFGQNQTAREPDETKYKRRTVVGFTAIRVNGKTVGPEIRLLRVKNRPRFKTLFRTRTNFLPELFASVDGLR